MTNLIDKLKQIFAKKQKSTDWRMTDETPRPATGLSEEDIKRLMHMIDHTHEGMYSCEETFDLLDEYVELVASHEEAAMLMPYVQRHLDLCEHCNEAYEALLLALTADFPPAT